MKISVVRETDQKAFVNAVNAEIVRLQQFDSATDIQIEYHPLWCSPITNTGSASGVNGYVIYIAFITYK